MRLLLSTLATLEIGVFRTGCWRNAAKTCKLWSRLSTAFFFYILNQRRLECKNRFFWNILESSTDYDSVSRMLGGYEKRNMYCDSPTSVRCRKDKTVSDEISRSTIFFSVGIDSNDWSVINVVDSNAVMSHTFIHLHLKNNYFVTLYVNKVYVISSLRFTFGVHDAVAVYLFITAVHSS